MSIRVKSFLKDVGGAGRVTEARREKLKNASAVPDPKDPIRDLADKGSCVIVGRCADWVLEKNYNVLRVYICADLDTRCKRAVEEYGDKAENIQKTVRDIDKQRARYCQHYCDQAWEDADNYDLCLNSGKLGVDHCAEVIRDTYQMMKAE